MLAPPAAAKQENAKLGELGNRQKKKAMREGMRERKEGRERGKERKGKKGKEREGNKVSPAGGGAAAWCTMCMSSDRLSE